MKLTIALFATLLAIATAQISVNSIEPLDIFAPVPVYPEDQISGRIVGGVEAEPHQFPYQVGLQIQIGDKQAWCGGSIISDEWVVTAAHCTDSADSVTVVLGAHNIKETEESALRIQVEKSNLFVHPKWSMATLQNDISLIKLPQKIEFNEFIQPIDLPTQSQVKETFVDKEVVASGWGKDTDKATTVSPVLRYVRVPVLAKWRCNIRYLGVIRDTHICIKGSGGKSTCSGDSGGPLVYESENGDKTLVGLTSFGLSFGCEIGWPGVFTRITSYLDWVSENTGIQIRA